MIEFHGYRKLIILQTLEIHQKIEKLLDEMKKATIQIEARFITVTEEFLDNMGFDANSIQRYALGTRETFIILDKLQFLRKRFEPGIEDSEVSSSSRGYGMILDDLQRSFVLRAIQAHKNSKMFVAPKVTVLNGEYASLSVLTDTLYVSGLTEPNTTLGQFEQQVDFVNTGTTIQVLPKITSQGDILLELNLSLSSVAGYEKRTYEDGNEYDVPNVELLSLSTQAMLPDGGTLLIGGGKVNTEDQDGQIAERDLLILIRADKIELDTGNDNNPSQLPARFSETDN